jgi:hypothetical protein
MKTKLITQFLATICILTACQTTTPSPSITTLPGTELTLTLAPGQSATITATDLTITFNSVLSDERCPSEIECAVSGPVTISLSVQQGSSPAIDLALQTCTDNNGRTPNVQFEGITDRVELGDYLIRIAGVTPYPTNLSTQIKPSEYQVAFIVAQK